MGEDRKGGERGEGKGREGKEKNMYIKIYR